ncbi:MAG: hypothetical protein M5U28_49135, partial [Sandaracinaceae bacterium]|nr:hypothetical protein [Sandaracinaceae bacterium]
QQAHRRRRRAPSGYELALSGATRAERGSALRLFGTAYEVEGLADLRPRERLDDVADSTEGAQPAGASRGGARASSNGNGAQGEPQPERPPPHAMPLVSPGTTAHLEHPARITTLRTRHDRGPPE